jgi:putative ABC transport system ATP-binding protein
MDAKPVIEISDIKKIYQMGETEVHALRGATLKIYEGELVAIMGPSGSGKSTLMNIIGCLDQPTSGLYKLDGVDVHTLKDNQLAEIRNRKIGFVFQQFNLLPRTTALQNVELPLIYSGTSSHHRRERAKVALEAVGLGDRLHHHPNELSGGQQQRVAIARAVISDPTILVADEPTGDLDRVSAAEVLRLMGQLNTELGKTIIMVTHDQRAARAAHRLVHLDKGVLMDGDGAEAVAGEGVKGEG